MISFSGMVSTLLNLSAMECFGIVLFTIISYHFLNRFIRYYTNYVSSYYLCLIFAILSFIGLCFAFVWHIVVKDTLYILLLIPMVYFGFQTYYDILNLYYCVFEKTDIDRENIGIKLDKYGMFNFIEEDGSTVPYKYLGSVYLENKNYIVTLDEEAMDRKALGNEELLVSIFEVEHDENDKKYVYFNGVDDQGILDKVIQKYLELHPSI